MESALKIGQAFKALKDFKGIRKGETVQITKKVEYAHISDFFYQVVVFMSGSIERPRMLNIYTEDLKNLKVA